MPSLKQLFGSPLGKSKHKKKPNKDRYNGMDILINDHKKKYTTTPKFLATENSEVTVSLFKEEEETERRGTLIESTACHSEEVRDEEITIDFRNYKDCVGDAELKKSGMKTKATTKEIQDHLHEESEKDETIYFEQRDHYDNRDCGDDEDFRTAAMPSKSKESPTTKNFWADKELHLPNCKDIHCENADIWCDNDDNFRIIVVPATASLSKPEEEQEKREKAKKHESLAESHHREQQQQNEFSMDEDGIEYDKVDDFRTTIMPTPRISSFAREEKEKSSSAKESESNKEIYVPQQQQQLQHELLVHQNDDFQTTVPDLQGMGESEPRSKESGNLKRVARDDNRYQVSPVNSVEFENHIHTTLNANEGATNSRSSRKEYSNKNDKTSSAIYPIPSHLNTTGYHLDLDDGDDEKENLIDDFDDYQSTISALTEATNYYNSKSINQNYTSSKTFVIVPPPSSPANHSCQTSSTSKSSSRHLEDFLKTETESLRKLLATVESGDDESTVVEESVRGANEAERMAKEMERETQLLLIGDHHGDNESMVEEEACCEGHSSSLKNDEMVQVVRPTSMESSSSYHYYRNLSPESNEFLADIRSVMHPVGCGESNKGKNSNTPLSNEQRLENSTDGRTSSPTGTVTPQSLSCSRDLFRKRSNLYQVKSSEKCYSNSSANRVAKQNRRRRQRRVLRKRIRTVGSTIVLILLCTWTTLLGHWQWNYPQEHFGTVLQNTASRIQHQGVVVLNDVKHTREKAVALLATTTKVTRSYIRDVLPPLADDTKVLVAQTIGNGVSFLADQAFACIPLARRAKTSALESIRDTTSLFATQAPSIARWVKTRTMNGLRITFAFFSDQLKHYDYSNGVILPYLKDRWEYAFTDRAEQEQRIREEEKLKELLAAAAAAAAKEAAEHQQMLWTQTMVAGACAFAGSVATTILWSVL